MLLGALVDAGADQDAVFATLSGLGVDGYALRFERVQRGGIAATWANVVTDAHEHDDHDDHGTTHHEHRPAKAITALLDAADLPDAGARPRPSGLRHARRAPRARSTASTPPTSSSTRSAPLDAIVDVVGIAAALHDLGIDRIVASPIAMGHGTTRSAHGVLPNPPPAVARLLASRDVPIVGVDTPMELATPTGVAVLVALAERFGPLPDDDGRARRLRRRHRRPRRPPERRAGHRRHRRRAERRRRRRAARPSQLEVNVDDVTGEVLAHTIAALLAAGAHDAWATPIVMKKGRPAHTVARPRRPRRRRAGRRRAARRDRQPRRPRRDGAPAGRSGATRSPSTSAVTRCGSRSRPGGRSPSTTTPSPPRPPSAGRCATSCATAETAARQGPPDQ